jgi:hypothetical protein
VLTIQQDIASHVEYTLARTRQVLGAAATRGGADLGREGAVERGRGCPLRRRRRAAGAEQRR